MIVELKTTKDKFSKMYLMLWNGTLHLTEKEMTLLSMLIDKYLLLKSQGISGEYVWQLLFSTQSRKEYKESMGGLTNAYLGNILVGLKAKKVVHVHGDTYRLDAKILPTKELTFKFEIVDE